MTTRRFRRRWLPLIVVATLAAACVPAVASTPIPTLTPTLTPPSPSPTASPVAATPSPMSTPGPTPAPTPSPTAVASCAEQTLASMTDAQRIGQVFVLGLAKNQLDAAERAAIARYHIGSMTFTQQTAVGVVAIRKITDSVQALATRDATDGVRFFIAANQEGGLIQGLSGPGFDVIPSAVTQGTWSPSLLESRAARWGAQLLKAGVNFDFAPVADVVPPGTDAENAPIGQLKREYGHDPATVASHVVAFVDGMTKAGVATSAKHFPGLGWVVGNTDSTADVVDTVTTRHDPYLKPFAAAVRAGVPFVMVSLATYEKIDPDHLAVFSPTIVDGMLRGDLGFNGVIISDALGGAKAIVAIPPATRAIDFLNAGGDLIISNQVVPATEMAQALAARAAAKPSFAKRVDDAALHVLEAKEAAGLLPCGG